MHEDLRLAEEKYAPRFKEAELIPDENARRARLEGLRNSFGTKQSMVRKKYGVRLRERRTKAEIQAERERMGLMKAEKERRRGGSGWTAANAASTTTPRPRSSSGEHDAKRRRVDDTGGFQTSYLPLSHEDTPSRKAPDSLQVPPPSNLVKVFQRGLTRVDIHKPTNTATTNRSGSDRVSPASGRTMNGAGASSRRSSSQERMPTVVAVDDDESSSDDDDEDIPSTLPTHT
ncbi:hypothetical protein N0V88_002844 [Collariella sp. IMI 366227]|nr:hypothetical protein N0V88_002844 [Collariella sp. IMI 366227]